MLFLSFPVLLCMNHHPAPGKILLMNVGAHAILCLAFSFLLCGFDATNLYGYRRPGQQRISTSHVLRRSYSVMPHACKWDPCPWIAVLILSAGSILPDPHFHLMFPAAHEQRGAFSVSLHSRWRQDALQAPPQMLQRTTGWDGCGHLPFRRHAMYYVEHQGSRWIFFSKLKNREFKLKHPKRLFDANNMLCLGAWKG